MENYNIIPLGDHCAIPMILNDLNLRKSAYPFDWIVHTEQIYNTNIIYNFTLVKHLMANVNIKKIVYDMIGKAFHSSAKINVNNNLWFPHDTEKCILTIYKKYERRFERLFHDITNKKNVFILLTRHYYIQETIIEEIMKTLLSFNGENKILFISGTDHSYLYDEKYKDKVIFKYISYDITRKFFSYDNLFRAQIKDYIQSLFATNRDNIQTVM